LADVRTERLRGINAAGRRASPGRPPACRYIEGSATLCRCRQMGAMKRVAPPVDRHAAARRCPSRHHVRVVPQSRPQQHALRMAAFRL